MQVTEHRYRIASTLTVVIVFGLLAAGSKEEPQYVPPPTPPTVIGKADAMAWARRASIEVATKMDELQAARQLAQREIHRLEGLKAQFLDRTSDIEPSITRWRKVETATESALDNVESGVEDAYVKSQVEGAAGEAHLSLIYREWSAKADAALRMARTQVERTEEP